MYYQVFNTKRTRSVVVRFYVDRRRSIPPTTTSGSLQTVPDRYVSISEGKNAAVPGVGRGPFGGPSVRTGGREGPH